MASPTTAQRQLELAPPCASAAVAAPKPIPVLCSREPLICRAQTPTPRRRASTPPCRNPLAPPAAPSHDREVRANAGADARPFGLRLRCGARAFPVWGGRPRLMRPASGARFHEQRRAADARLVVSGLSTGLVTGRGLAAMAIARLAPLSDLGPLAPRSPPRSQRGQHHPCSAASGCLVPVPKLSWRLQPPGSPPAYPARPRSGVPRRRLCATMPRPHGPSVARRPRQSVPMRRVGTILVNRSP